MGGGLVIDCTNSMISMALVVDYLIPLTGYMLVYYVLE